ncbi:MAG TPA: GLPGLI family protein [Sediminibacterium sp.]|nr:GLPGLI family protein [Sediminibacterium sp.]
MWKYFYILLPTLFIGCFANAQSKFVEGGRIVFERKINTYAVLPEFIGQSTMVSQTEQNAYLQDYKSKNPQFLVDSFQLIFNTGNTAYEPIGQASAFFNGLGAPIANSNRIFFNHSKSIFFAEKNAFSETKMISDSIIKIQWKLTDETREIAGYTCRRANALIRDSVYVVAFYTDAIIPKSGPELFVGLPGMILGVALPHYHISYFAKTVKPEPAIVLPDLANVKPRANTETLKDFISEGLEFLKKFNLYNNWMRVFISL